jgi:hypothetical protein
MNQFQPQFMDKKGQLAIKKYGTLFLFCTINLKKHLKRTQFRVETCCANKVCKNWGSRCGSEVKWWNEKILSRVRSPARPFIFKNNKREKQKENL